MKEVKWFHSDRENNKNREQNIIEDNEAIKMAEELKCIIRIFWEESVPVMTDNRNIRLKEGETRFKDFEYTEEGIKIRTGVL